MVRFPAEQLKKLGVAMFEAAGVPSEEAEIVTEILVSTSLHGVDSHGVRAIPRYIKGIKEGGIVPGTEIKVLVESPTTAMWDAGLSFGFVAGRKAMDAAIRKAEKYKMGSVGTKGPGHIGALYWYSMLDVEKDMIGITLCRGGGHRAVPYGGVDGRLGINPLSIAIPAGEARPIVLDMATTGVAMGHLQVMSMRGQDAPEGWLIRPDGTWDTDPMSYKDGDSSPVCFGHPYSEHKGYGLSVVIEALAGAIGSGCCLQETGFGHMYTAIDPTGFTPLEDFKANVDSMVRDIKSAAKRPGFEEILLPGEPEWNEEEIRRREGVFVDDPWWKDIVETANELGLDFNSIMQD
jgi:LDH2 family malate/lactate/ureidoglycolate dehydrogenase